MANTGASHQGATERLWLKVWGALMSSICGLHSGALS